MRASTTSLSLTGVTNLAVMAPLRTGFVPVADTITYLKRLDLLLTALNAARVAARESMIGALPFPDAIGRFRMIHSFRYAVFPPKHKPPAGDEPTAGRYLTLNVTFDGGFEPYMRVIYDDLGPLLDALFCHADPANGYPMSRGHSFDTYCRWVRNNELPEGLFYVDSAMTLGDQRYLERLERLQRENRDPADADRRIAELALDSAAGQHTHAMLAAWNQRERVAWHQLRALKGLHRLLPFFDCDGDRDVLWRFSRSLLSDFQELLDQGFLDGDGFKPLRLQFAEEMLWLRGPKPPLEEPRPPAIDRAWVPEQVQAGIVDGFDGITHGALALLEITEPPKARTFLQQYPATGQGQQPAAGGIVRTLAFSWSGLQRLGLRAKELDHLAPEFREGMEARAGLLGDVRTNHPDHWRRPFRAGAPADAGDADRIDLDTVHVVVALRLADPDVADSSLHPVLAHETLALDNHDTSGMRLLAVQPMRSWPEAAPDGALHSREHFGFLDGFSQPRPSPAVVPPGLADDVPVGDFVLGHRNGHKDPPYPEQPNDLLDHGSYLVVRKLRQRIDRLNAQLEQQLGGGSIAAAQAAKVGALELMMGRGMDGQPLVPLPAGAGVTGNAFDYAADPTGRLCPLHSHVRRSNPRDGKSPMPRLMRRGMSYGPRVTGPANLDAERGVVFMAYCASIAEQFEVVQRWISGGNSSGVSSRHADPFMAVPEPGERRTWRIPVGTTGVRRLDLGDQPFVELEWGIYLFVPSLHALTKLDALSQELPKQASQQPPDVATPLSELAAWQTRLESPVDDERDEAWKLVRESPGGVLETAYGKLVGSLAAVEEALRNENGAYSVRGYGARMADSIGHGYLGMDDPRHSELAKGVNKVLRGVERKDAFTLAWHAGTKVLQRARLLALAEPGGSVKVPVDLIAYSEAVLGLLCQAWFGLPDVPPPPSTPPAPQPLTPHMVLAGRKPGGHAAGDLVRCPGHLMMTSRFIFSTWPSLEVKTQATEQGKAFNQAVRDFLGDPSAKRGPLTEAVLKALPATATDEDKPNTVAGVMLGFPPTVHGNFVRTITRLQETRELWALQRRLQPHLVQHAANPPALFDEIDGALADALLKTMRQQPVPETIWRLPADPEATQRVVLGLASAMKDPDAPPTLMFGGDPTQALHACPGYEMAVGVLCGMLAALLAAGQWRTTGSTMQLLLVKPGR